ncbi:hypothetical protein BS329_15830 [Amycolatopsis coloradensis]|uniref:Methyltransferase n=1 Tax=Amycolatopsis coloradensis TaxID=76021 RepID=A0A1R0KUG3_9PSEU|nr:hypothetical protein BS329_15830 [Amycolatopsis coloradensis]
MLALPDLDLAAWLQHCICRTTCGCFALHTSSGRATAQRTWASLRQACAHHPQAARIENTYRDGKRAWERDKLIAATLSRIAPHTRTAVRIRDAFTTRVVSEALAHGVDQFLDLGSGHVYTSAAHTVVTRAKVDPAPRIVMVDNDEVVHANNIIHLERTNSDVWSRTFSLRRNAFAVGRLLNYLDHHEVLDLQRPVCVLLIDLLHYLEPGLDTSSVTRRFIRRLAPGSWLAISVLTDTPLLAPARAGMRTALRETTAQWCQAHAQTLPPLPTPRRHAEVERMLTGLDLYPAGTGITTPRRWPLPDNTRTPRAPFSIAAVGHVPARPTPIAQAIA